MGQFNEREPNHLAVSHDGWMVFPNISGCWGGGVKTEKGYCIHALLAWLPQIIADPARLFLCP